MLRNHLAIFFFSFFAMWKASAQMPVRFLNNPYTGIVSYDFRIGNKVTNFERIEFSSSSNYIYLSDVLRDNCLNSNGKLDKIQFYRNIKRYCDSIFNFNINQRHEIRIFPDYNGSEPCRNSCVINSNLTDDGKLLINYPKNLYYVLSRQKYPPIKIKAMFPRNFKITQNIALLDFRNATVQNIYDTALALLYQYFQEPVVAPELKSASNAKTTIRKGDFIGRIKMGYIGPWGEGITNFFKDDMDSKSLIKIAEMYKKYFHDYWLIAPSYGMRINTTKNEKLFEFEYYLLTTKYGSLSKKNGYFTGNKAFGLYIDHIGTSDCDRDFTLSYKGQSFRSIAMQKYKVAPVIGENSGSLKLEERYLVQQIKDFGISLCKVWINSETQIADSLQYPVWKENSPYFGYRFYINGNHTSIKGNTLNVCFLMGNRSYSPLYDDFWLPQIVIRDKDGKELQVIDIDKDLNLKSIPCLKSPLNYEVMVNTKKQLNVATTGCKVYFRIIDKCHINENMYLDNDGRTDKGEYLLLNSH